MRSRESSLGLSILLSLLFLDVADALPSPQIAQILPIVVPVVQSKSAISTVPATPTASGSRASSLVTGLLPAPTSVYQLIEPSSVPSSLLAALSSSTAAQVLPPSTAIQSLTAQDPTSTSNMAPLNVPAVLPLLVSVLSVAGPAFPLPAPVPQVQTAPTVTALVLSSIPPVILPSPSLIAVPPLAVLPSLARFPSSLAALPSIALPSIAIPPIVPSLSELAIPSTAVPAILPAVPALSIPPLPKPLALLPPVPTDVTIPPSLFSGLNPAQIQSVLLPLLSTPSASPPVDVAPIASILAAAIPTPVLPSLPSIPTLVLPPLQVPSLTGLPNIPVGALPTEASNVLPAVNDAISSLIAGVAEAIPTDLLVDPLIRTGLPGLALPATPSGLPDILPGINNAASGLVNGVLGSVPTGLPTLQSNGLPTIPNINLAAPPLTPALPLDTLLSSGTVVNYTHKWTFYSTGVVQVDQTFLSPLAGLLANFLPDGTTVGLYLDGLHIGAHVVAYSPAFEFLVRQFGLALLPLQNGLGSGVLGLPVSDST